MASPSKPAERPAAPDAARAGGPPAALQALVVVATIAVVGWLVGDGLAQARQGPARVRGELLRVAPREGVPVAFELPSLRGGAKKLDDYAGKIVLLNFWATWCPPCIEEMPSMRRFHAKLAADPRFVLVAVSADESWEPVKRFFGDDPPAFEVLLDEGGELARKYGTTMFPETYVIRDGKIIGFIEGPRNWDDWFAAGYVEALVAAR
jgi:thiol-disulfide isomerase/thioredoxin